MRKLLFYSLAIVGLVCAYAPNASAQVDVTANPIGLLFGDVSVGADFVITDNISVEGAFGFGSNEIDDVKGNNFSTTALGKYYFSPKNGADRFYVDVFMRYINRQWEYDDNSDFANYTSNRFGVGFGLGYKIVSVGGFVFDINLGAGRAFVDNQTFESDGVEESVDWPEIMFQGKLGIGYRFGGK